MEWQVLYHAISLIDTVLTVWSSIDIGCVLLMICRHLSCLFFRSAYHVNFLVSFAWLKFTLVPG
ncbi:hypothetical protein BCR43DRAFT_499721 [Syncephalastrum racemosum]|uniref:Uncharacterized protein n=1 Tax=Syncephalastrum racemosum TaxID=13706 RepID=A0A1X2H0P3_SYNRA|nr:hypothetical protein BCR43DRAFT_499721 [Syncephalastrum racemosum]